MRKSRFSVEQILGILKEHAAGESAGTLCRRHGISQQTLYRWKAKYVGLEGNELKRLKALEKENARLKRLVAEQAVDNQALKRVAPKKLVKPAQRRAAVAYTQERFGLSQRRACRLVSSARSMIRYESRHRGADEALRPRLRDLATQRPRFGYQRLHVLMRREGLVVNHKRIERLYLEEGVAVRRRTRRSLTPVLRGRPALP